LAIGEEPENGFDRLHCWVLAEQIRSFERRKRNQQLLLTSHDSNIADILHPSQVWVFEKDREGFTVVERASDSLGIREEGEITENDSPIPDANNWFKRFEDKI
jgi:Fe-S cluster assembly ATPase SufC